MTYPVLCCIEGCDRLAENVDTMLCASHGWQQRKAERDSQKSEQKKATKKPVKKVSDKMAEALKEYAKLRKMFLALNPNCAVYPGRPSVEVHHMAGRNTIELLLNTDKWLAVSREGHREIELNPNWAKEKGFSLSRLVNEQTI